MALGPHPPRRADPPRQTSQRVWVLDDPRAGTAAQAIGIAERLGVPFLRIPLTWNWMAHVAALSRHGSLLGLAGTGALPRSQLEQLPRRPASETIPTLTETGETIGPDLVVSAGSRSASVALWLKARTGCRIVHCMRPNFPGVGLSRAQNYDLLVIPEHDNPPVADNVLPVLGVPHRLSPEALRQAAAAWDERLCHLPHPRIALLVGGPVRGADMQPARAHSLGRKVARLATQLGGCVLATTSRRTGAEATDALAAGLQRALHVLYRWGEPGDNPYEGFLAMADVIVVTADSISMISEACATAAPVYVALPEQGGQRHRRMIATLREAGQVRLLERTLAPFPRHPLDEAGRIAAEMHRRFILE